jgi:hypothetical protein
VHVALRSELEPLEQPFELLALVGFDADPGMQREARSLRDGLSMLLVELRRKGLQREDLLAAPSTA